MAKNHNCCSYLLSKLCSYNLLVKDLFSDQVTCMVLERMQCISVERSEQFNITCGFSNEEHKHHSPSTVTVTVHIGKISHSDDKKGSLSSPIM